MITDKILQGMADGDGVDEPTEEEIEQLLEGANVEFAEVIDAAKKLEKPYLLCILSHGGMGAWENCNDDPVNKPEDLQQIVELAVAIVAEQIAFDKGEEALAAWLARLVASNL